MKDLLRLSQEALGMEFDPNRFLVVGNARQKLSVFLFDNTGRNPVVVARIPGHPYTEKQCRTEHESFRLFARQNVPGILVPEPLGEVKYKEYTCFFQGVITSRQWQSRIPNWRAYPRKADFIRATEYLIRMCNSTRMETEAGETRCFEHGDFWMGNLGQKGSSLVLYDLEYANAEGQPLYDLFHFCLYYRVALRNRNLVGREVTSGTYNREDEKRVFSVTREDIHTVFIDPGPFRVLVSECIKRYGEACTIDSKDAADRLKQYVENSLEGNRGIQGFPVGWELAVTGNS